MRKIFLQQLQSGMVLAKTIYGPAGQVLLSAGKEVKPQYAVYLRHMGIESLYIQDKRIGNVVADEILTEETRQEARLLVKELMEGVGEISSNKSIAFADENLKVIVNKIIEELLSIEDVVVSLLDIRAAAGYAFAHSVNTCVLATLTGAKLNYNTSQIKTLATGSLLHDIGYIVVPPEILQKKSILDQDEYGVVKTHPLFGLELFKHSSLYTEDSGAVIHQHHERRNGKGYPKGLVKDRINVMAQIAAIADVYDALTSPRPYRRAYHPNQAVEMLSAWGDDYFNLEILRTFLSFIAVYPVGTHVLLSNGESGLVTANTPGYTTRPVVRVLYTREGMAHHPLPYDLDLTETLDLTVTKVLDDIFDVPCL